MRWQFVPHVPTQEAYKNRFFKETYLNLQSIETAMKEKKCAYEGQIFLKAAADERRKEQMIAEVETDISELQARIKTEGESAPQWAVDYWVRKAADAAASIEHIRADRISHEYRFRGLWEFNDIMKNQLNWDENAVQMIYLYKLGSFQR